jgi:hypothetical protein
VTGGGAEGTGLVALAGRRGRGCYQVELVAFRVGEGGPPDRRPVEAAQGRGAKAGEAVAFLFEPVGAQVQVQAPGYQRRRWPAVPMATRKQRVDAKAQPLTISALRGKQPPVPL